MPNPIIYHGHRKTAPFFEGWYFKWITADASRRYACIPGIFMAQNPADSHAFIQILDGLTGKSVYHRFPREAFWASKTHFELRIGENFFSAERIYLDLAQDGQSIQGEIRQQDLKPWPVTWDSVGAMGWFGYLPFLECNHGVVSVDHRLEGHLSINGEDVDFAGGRGYSEKDWGSSFPSGYVWLQCNHFSQSGISLMSSIAMIPRLGIPFRGFICGFYFENHLYRFATYTGARLGRLQLSDTDVSWHYRGAKHRLEIHAQRSTGGLLKAPYAGQMQERVMESLTASVEVRFIRLADERVLFQDRGNYVGLEVAGNLSPLLDQDLRQKSV